MPIELICLDADDTLWHNMRHFEAAEQAVQALLAPFADIDVTQARRQAVEARNLALYGYGVDITGVYDRQTRQVVAAFQRHFRPERIDGEADASTVATLKALIQALERN